MGGDFDGCRVRIGGMGTGGMGSGTDDLRRAGTSSSSNTVSWVRALKGLIGVFLPAAFASWADFAGCFDTVDVSSSSALIAIPIWSSGNDTFEFEGAL